MSALTDADRSELAWAASYGCGCYMTVSLCESCRIPYEQTLLAVEQIVAAALAAAASAIDTRRHTHVQSGGLPELIPSNHADAERLGHLDGLAAAAEIVRNHAQNGDHE